MDPGSAILFATAAVVGLGALVCVARAIGARGTAARVVWIGRVLALLGAATAIAFPAVLYRELVDIAVPRGADISWMPTGIAQTALLIPLTVVPAFVSLRWTRLGGVLFLFNAIVSAAFVAYDPFGAFPERDVSGGLVFDVGPRLVTALLLLGPGLIASSVSRSSPMPVARL
jgi:Na+/alanine symporter